MSNPEHIQYIKEYFNERTEKKAVAKLIRWFAIERKDESERLTETLRGYIEKANKYERLKELYHDMAKSEQTIKKLLEND